MEAIESVLDRLQCLFPSISTGKFGSNGYKDMSYEQSPVFSHKIMFQLKSGHF
jgi:hypothetical protein